MYIAYSMAHDTVSEKVALFNSVQELVANAEMHGIRFGALKGGATESFFKVCLLRLTKRVIYLAGSIF